MSRTRKIMVFLLLLFLMSTGIFVFLHSPGFYLTSFEVVGNRHLTRDDVLDLSGLWHGEHLLVAFDRAVHQAILSSPWIARASVRIAYPGRVIVTVEEREPAAVLSLPGGDFYLVDRRGVLIEQRPTPGGAAVIISGLGVEDTATRSRTASQRMLGALRVVHALSGLALPLAVQEVNVQQHGEITLFLAGGVRALLGPVGADLGHALEVLQGVLDGLGEAARGVDYVDLRFGRAVVQQR